MTLRLRQATSADSQLLSDLGYEIYPAHFAPLWVSEAEMNDFLAGEYALPVLEKSLREEGVTWYVAQTDRPIGFTKVSWEAAMPGTGEVGVLLNKIYLAPAETGKNYGQVMFEQMVQLARNKGKTMLWLEVLEQNEGAYRFYQKQGMLCVNEVAFETASQRSMLKIMRLSL
ncbi:GNAT family N-acetyltransferase [Enterobacter wuhouensis]|uniref:GNAT family N-acetyltransferase n=1 Tax=Enterobacter wuhouensis TaxID=2529381 RepID=UPI003525C9F3